MSFYNFSHEKQRFKRLMNCLLFLETFFREKKKALNSDRSKNTYLTENKEHATLVNSFLFNILN